MAISAQGATITFDGVALSEVVDYAVDVSAIATGLDGVGTVRVNALANNAVPRSKFRRIGLLTIKHGTSEIFRGWVFAGTVRIGAATNDIVRYTIEFIVISLPLA